jgi:hypothetical protein
MKDTAQVLRTWFSRQTKSAQPYNLFYSSFQLLFFFLNSVSEPDTTASFHKIYTIYCVKGFLEKKAKSEKRREEIKPVRNVGVLRKKQNVGVQVAVNSFHKTTVVKRAKYKKRQLGAAYSVLIKSPILAS